MIFVDTNVFMYAVGRPHTLQADARGFFERSLGEGEELVTSAEVLQELLHAYLPVNRIATLDAALRLVAGTVSRVWEVEPMDVWFARDLIVNHPELGARDLVHLACCRRRGVRRIKTFDRALAARSAEE